MAAISSLLVVVFVVHFLMTGTIPPHQDPSPERVAYERFHNQIGLPLFIASAFSMPSTFLLAMAWASNLVYRRVRPARGGPSESSSR